MSSGLTQFCGSIGPTVPLAAVADCAGIARAPAVSAETASPTTRRLRRDRSPLRGDFVPRIRIPPSAGFLAGPAATPPTAPATSTRGRFNLGSERRGVTLALLADAE